MKMRAIIFVYVVLICMFSGVIKAQNNDIEKAKGLWEKVIAAKGGREKLYAVKNLVVITKSYSPYDKKEFSNSNFVNFYLLPDKWWSWLDERPGFSLKVRQYDFGQQIGYEVEEGRNQSVYVVESRNKSELGKQLEYKIYDNYVLSVHRPEKSQDSLKRSLEIIKDDSSFNNNIKTNFFENQLLYLLETKWFQPKIESSRIERSGFKKVNVIEVSFGKEKIEYFIDPKTNLPNQIKMRTWIEETKRFYEDGFFLEDYIEVEGVKFPQIIRRGKKTDTKTTYQVNVKYNESLFNSPPSIDMGVDAWKPK